MTIEEALFDVAKRLGRHGVRCALVGGLAVSIRAEVRFTRDVDLAIAVGSDAEVESLTRALIAEGFALVAVVMQDERARIAIARIRSPSGVIIDLLAASSSICSRRRQASRRRSWPVPRWSKDSKAMRAARLQDEIDARSLLSSQTIDLVLVKRTLELIETRGYARGQDLQTKLATLLAAES